jgi:hypothetical protein
VLLFLAPRPGNFAGAVNYGSCKGSGEGKRDSARGRSVLRTLLYHASGDGKPRSERSDDDHPKRGRLGDASACALSLGLSITLIGQG